MAKRNEGGAALAPAVRAALASVRLGELSDGELLARFVAGRDQEAFAELVRRLGPTVYGVCRRALRDPGDAEDAFQVTFLVLARKADTVRPPGRVAAWLYGVAVLAARKARAARLRRLGRETALGDAPEPAAAAPEAEPDLARVLDEEVQRLPDKYRSAVVLCEVRELTVARAAAELGLPVGTVASRLSRGRALLAARLARRGFVALATAGALAATAAARVPPKLFGSTISAAIPGPSGAAVVPPLLDEVLRAMTLNTIRTFAAAVALSGVLALGGAGLLPSAEPAALAAPAPAAPVPKAAPDATDPLARVKPENLGGLLKVEAVRKDLGLTEEQAKKLDAAQAELLAKHKQNLPPRVIQAPAGGAIKIGGGGVMVGGTINDPEFDKAAAEVLKPEQLRRLKQLSLQAMGPSALLDRRVIRALGLTAEQEDKIEAAAPPQRAGVVNRVVVINGGARDLEVEKIEAGWEAALKVLTPEQRTKWDATVGKMLPVADLRKAVVPSFEELRGMIPNLPNVVPFNPGQFAPPG